MYEAAPAASAEAYLREAELCKTYALSPPSNNNDNNNNHDYDNNHNHKTNNNNNKQTNKQTTIKSIIMIQNIAMKLTCSAIPITSFSLRFVSRTVVIILSLVRASTASLCSTSCSFPCRVIRRSSFE
jgi:hypothetical protein